jgi:hypothetical protein
MLKLDYASDDVLTDNQNESSDGKKSGLTSNSKFYYPTSTSIPSLATIDVTDLDYLESQPGYMLDGSYGVDKIKVSLILDPNSVVHADFLSNVWGSDGNKTNGRVRLPGQPGVNLFWPDTGAQVMSIHFNPSNFSRIDGFDICPPYLLGHYVQQVITQVLAIGDPQARPCFMSHEPWNVIGPWPRDWTAYIRVNDLHLARDMFIQDPRFNLAQMRTFKPVKMTGIALYVSDDGEIETVTHPAGKGTARHQVYNKHKERAKLLASRKKDKAVSLPVPKGTFRYEIQIPRVALAKNHLNSLTILTPERLWKLGLNYWGNSNYHKPLIWQGQVASEMSTVLTDTEIAESLQYIRNVHLGVQMNYSAKEVKKIERLIKKAGVSQKKQLTTQGLSYGSLDFETGGLICLP